MALTISFDLQEQDLDYFRQLMQKSERVVGQHSSEEILNAAKALAGEVKNQVPEFVAIRLKQLETLVDMVEDIDWDLTDDEKLDVLSALAYFTKPEDLIADHLPVLGFLDDAIMIELVVQSLADDFEAYTEFCTFRRNEIERRGPEAQTSKADWLESKKQELHSWLRRRRAEKRSSTNGGGFRSVFSFRR